MKKLFGNKKTKDQFITYGTVILSYVIVQVFIYTGSLSRSMQNLLVPLVYSAICAIGLNLCVVILGELSLGHAGFMCIGAFTSAVFSISFSSVLPSGIRFFLAFAIGVSCAALFGFLIGIPVLRLKGDYLAIVTLAFGEIIKNVLNAFYLGYDKNGIHLSMDMADFNLEPGGTVLINGASGISGTPRDSNFTIGIIALLFVIFISLNLINSKDGRAIMAIRDNAIAAKASGINVTKYKILAFTISAAIAGAGGVLYSHNISGMMANSQTFGYNVSITMLVYVVLGGMGNIRGSMISAVILYLLPELLRGMNKYRMLIYAVVLILIMIFNWSPFAIGMREKLFGKIKRTGNGIA